MKGTTRFGLAGLAAASAVSPRSSTVTRHRVPQRQQAARLQGSRSSSDRAGIVWSTPGVATRISQGLINPDTGEGFHGLVAFDFDGDGTIRLPDLRRRPRR